MKTRKKSAQDVCNVSGKYDVMNDLLNSLNGKESYHIISVGSKGLENIRHFNVAIAEYNLLLKMGINPDIIILLGDFLEPIVHFDRHFPKIVFIIFHNMSLHILIFRSNMMVKKHFIQKTCF
jgi:hypothetical protein